MKQLGVRWLVLLVFLSLAAASSIEAGRGAAELTLDRGSVAGLIEAALPPPLTLDIPGLGRQTIAVGAPREVEFLEGGIELILPLRVGGLGQPLRLEVRMEPSIERIEGEIKLVPVRFNLVGIPALPLELATWVEPVALPRRLQWSLPLADGQAMDVVGFVQGLRVLEDRLELELALTSAPSQAEAGSR